MLAEDRSVPLNRADEIANIFELLLSCGASLVRIFAAHQYPAHLSSVVSHRIARNTSLFSFSTVFRW